MPATIKTASPSELLHQLNDLSIDPAQIYVLRGAQISRDRVNIYFNQGFIGFLDKVDGQVTGAVFSGEGEVLLIPPNSAEKASLAGFTGAPILEEKFTFAYMRFTDQTARQLLALARAPDPRDLEQPTGFADSWNAVVHRLNGDFSVRILQDLLGRRDRPYFQAQVQGVEQGVFTVSVDERTSEAVRVGASRLNHGNVYADVWCSFPSRAAPPRSAKPELDPVRVRSYKLDTQINEDNSLEGHADLDLESESSADRILIFQFSNRLRVSEVRDEQNHKLDVFQGEPFVESGGQGGDNWIAVVLPSPRPAGSQFRLTFTYQGNVIADVGNGVLYVGARGSWYPNLGPQARATYDLTFRYPDRLTLVATGHRIEESSADGWKHSRWVSDGEFPVAGFNLGAYHSRTRKAGKIEVEIYATPEAEEALESRNSAPQFPPRPMDIPGRSPGVIDTLPVIQPPLSPSALLDHMADNASGAVSYFETLFGPFPYPRLAISQIPGRFGQGWPELVYLPTLSFLQGYELAELGLTQKGADLSGQVIVPHEIAHQWWGNALGWKTEHDQWLSEGFASYAAALYLSQQKGGGRKLHEILRDYMHDLMEKNAEGNTIESGGPIWFGHRLSNSLNPGGYDDIVYKKACWVLHMLHVLMTDPGTGSDARFFKMLRDFVADYRGTDPSTEDFIRHADKYMTPAMDLDHNHRLDWFFLDWVYGTGIPTYKLRAITRQLSKNKFLTQGTIDQSGVSVDFEMLVPVEATYGREKKATLGLVAVTAEGGHFKFFTRFKPTRVTIDEDSLLAVIR
ncbi:MAG TPA: M1 family aminopeptidase [Terriglobia bacterium]|nr:M1 family aminopeptidase [Terriglobia bacterium]